MSCTKLFFRCKIKIYPVKKKKTQLAYHFATRQALAER